MGFSSYISSFNSNFQNLFHHTMVMETKHVQDTAELERKKKRNRGEGVFAFKLFLSQNFPCPCAMFPFTLKATGFIIQEPFPLVENGHPPVLVCSNRSNESRAYSAPFPRRLVGPTSAIR